MRFGKKLRYNLFLLSFLLESCGHLSGVGRNINLKNFPERRDVSEMNVYWYFYDGDHSSKRDEYGFKPLVWGEFQKYGLHPTPEQVASQKKDLLPKSGCVLDIEDGGKYAFDPKGIFGRVYAEISGITFFIIPYYLPGKRNIKGTLIDSKTGEILKEYSFEEKEIQWRALLPIFWFIPGYDDVSNKTPYAGTKLNEALIRTVTNDVYNFTECRKR